VVQTQASAGVAEKKGTPNTCSLAQVEAAAAGGQLAVL